MKQHPKNPNIHPQKQIDLLAKNINEMGWRSPVTVSKRSGYIIRGHGRLEAAKVNGYEHVPVDYQDYADEAAELVDLVADNRLAELSYMDSNLLDDVLEQIRYEDIDFELTGFDDNDANEAISIVGVEAEEEKPEIEFTEVLREEHNYIVLYFDNEVDWLQAQTVFDIKTVKALSTRKDGKITKGRENKGIGRVINGAKALEALRNADFG